MFVGGGVVGSDECGAVRMWRLLGGAGSTQSVVKACVDGLIDRLHFETKSVPNRESSRATARHTTLAPPPSFLPIPIKQPATSLQVFKSVCPVRVRWVDVGGGGGVEGVTSVHNWKALNNGSHRFEFLTEKDFIQIIILTWHYEKNMTVLIEWAILFL